MLATSRSPLRISGEVEYPLEPLPTSDAVVLFAERSRAVGRALVPDEAVEAICRRLDGLPLAIELAAARMKLLTPETLLERLESALPLLTGGARDAPERQRTLEETIAWSYDLLDDHSKRLLARLSVFAGSFPITLAETVCEADIDTLAALVDSSLLKAVGGDRFLLLETIREYARDRLVESGALADVRLPSCRGVHRARGGGVRAALRGGSGVVGPTRARSRRPAGCSRLACTSATLTLSSGWRALSGGSGSPTRISSRAGDGSWMLCQRQASKDALRARALTAAGVLVAWQGEVDVARAELEEALGIWSTVGDHGELASAFDALGWMLVYAPGDNDGALEAFEKSLEIRRGLSDRVGERRALCGVCQVLVAMGEVERATALSRELLGMAEGDPRSEHFAFHFLADCALIDGECEVAEQRYRESLRAALPLGDVIETSFEVQGVAMAAAGSGDLVRGIQLAAAVEALWESLGTTFSIPFWDALLRALYRHRARRLWELTEPCTGARGGSLPSRTPSSLLLVPGPREPDVTS